MKKALLSAIFLLVVAPWAFAQASCLPNGIVLATQAQVDSFPILYPDCTTIAGNVTIGMNNSKIHDLSPLANITSIDGYLYFLGNDSLQNLSGLENLTYIGGYLKLLANPSLVNLSGLTNLEEIDGDLYIQGCHGLTDLTGMDHIQSLGGYLLIRNNASLASLNGLNWLTTIYKYLTIMQNHALTDLSGLDQLHQVSDYIDISNNNSLQNLEGLNALSYVGTDLSIYGNMALTDMTALSNLTHVYRTLNISNNPILPSLQGLHNLTWIGEQVFLVGNYVLQDLTPLNQLDIINNNFYLYALNAITNLAGLENIQKINGFLRIQQCESLQNLDALSQLDSIGRQLIIINNPLLTDISGLSNVQTVYDDIEIYDNPLLSDCAIFVVCNKLLSASNQVSIQNNGPGCNNLVEVEESCGAQSVWATVLIDQNANCLADGSDTPVENVQVQLAAPVQNTLRATDAGGIARFGYLDEGVFSLSLPQFPTASWAACYDTVWLNPDTIVGIAQPALLLQALNDCPDLAVELELPPFFRGCLVTTGVQISTVNIGGATAQDVQVAVVLPLSVMEVVSSTPPVAFSQGDTLYFDMGNLAPFAAAHIDLEVRTLCDTFLLGQTLCTSAFVSASNDCPAPPDAFSEIIVQPECLADTLVRFTLKNIGDAPTQGLHTCIIIEDEVVLMSHEFQLGPQEMQVYDIPTDGSTYRVEATRFDNGELTAAAIENCGGLTPGLITAYWLNEGDENYDFDCRMVSQAFDPNQKTAIPTGVGEDHLLAANRPIHYTIEFQNTGTDTAFRVQLLDVLSPHLDISTFRPGYASHPYTWEVRSADTLEVLFYPIALPDSMTNEAASKGFFSYTIDQKPNLPDGTLIENTASIIFDFNPPIVTNTVFHTIGKLVVAIDELQSYPQLWKVLGNPIHTTAIFRATDTVQGENLFYLYDSNGRPLRSDRFFGPEFNMDCSALTGGVYFFQVVDAKGRPFTGKLIIAR